MNLDREFRRSKKFLAWLINGYGQHGITPMRFPFLTPEMVEELYQVDFGD
jgi:hypothetical protein